MTRNGGGFVVESALYELLRYASKYNQQITSNLRLSGLEAKAQLFDGIEDIHNLPKVPEDDMRSYLKQLSVVS